GERNTEGRGVLAGSPACKTFEKKLEAGEGSSPETVDGLIVVADRKDVFAITGEKFEQTELRDVRVLKLVNEDVAIFFLQSGTKRGILIEEFNGTRDERAEGNALLFAQKFLAGAIGARDFEMLFYFFEAFVVGVVIEGKAFALESGRETFRVALIVFP